MRNRKDRWHYIMVAVLMGVLALAMGGIPGVVQAANFGGLSDNGTAAYMGIGNNPHSKRPLWVFGNIALFERASDSAGFIIQRSDTNRWVFGVNDNPTNNPTAGKGFVISTYPLADEQSGIASKARLLVTPEGRVGINTVNPYTGAKLTVVNDNTTDLATAIYGETPSGNTGAVSGRHVAANTWGALGCQGNGYGSGVYGESDNTSSWGFLGGMIYDKSGVGAYGKNEISGNYGGLGGFGAGAFGFTANRNSPGVYGESTSDNNSTGVCGKITNSGSTWSAGVYGESNSPSSAGVSGRNTAGGPAGYFDGNAFATGTMTAAKMAYSAARTHYFSVPAASFTPQNSGLGYSKVTGLAGAYITDSSGYMYAPVYLPDGAVVTGFKGYFYDNSANDLSISLKRQDLMGFNTSMASVASALTPGYGSASTTSITGPTISNNGYAYFVEAYWATGDGANLEVTGAVITYTISEAE